MKISSLFLSLTLATGAALAAGPATPTPAVEPLVLTPENTVILDNSVYAGAELQHYLLKYYVSPEVGAKHSLDVATDRAASPGFPLVKDDGQSALPAGKNIIAVGDTRFLTADDRTRLASQPLATLVRRQGNVIVVAGSPVKGSWNGPYYGVAKFLDVACGIRFYGPEDPWISAPREKKFTVGELNVFEPWSFPGLTVDHYKRNLEWERMNGNRGTMRATHNLAIIFDPQKHAKTHPEIYEMKKGARPTPSNLYWNPCLSAPALPDLAMEFIRERMKADPSTMSISFGVQDCSFDCECPDCQASVKQHQGSYSTLYYTFLNKVARRCQKEFPGLYLTTYVYSNVRTPPVGLRIESNIVVDVVIKSYRFVEPKWLDFEKGRIQAFSDLGASWAIHDWCFSDVSPRSYMRQYASFLQWAAKHGMVGAVIETSYEDSWYLDGPKYWLLMQLMQNPYRDIEAMYRQYCTDLYGAASEVMFRFFRHFDDKYAYATDYIELADLPRQEPALYSPADLKYQRSLLEEAISMTKDTPVIQERLAKVMRYFIAHELWAKAVYDPQRLFWNFKGTGINQAALAFYVTEEGHRLQEAMDYYLTKRDLPPDANQRNTQLGIFPTLISNYTRAKEVILGAIRREAMTGLDLTQPNRQAAEQVIARSLKILQVNLPAKRNSAKVREFEDALKKTLFIPRVETMPSIDGDLSDAVWSKGAVLEDFTERDLLEKTPHETTGRVMRVGDRLVFGLTCKQKGDIWAWSKPEAATGSMHWKESGIEIFVSKLQQGEEEPPFIQYMVNSLGACVGYGLARQNHTGVQAAVRMDKEKNLYTVEIAFPLKGEGYDLTGERLISLNLMRKANTKTGATGEGNPPSVTGWYPIFNTASKHSSRGIVFMEPDRR
jgi:hypothetical protein